MSLNWLENIPGVRRRSVAGRLAVLIWAMLLPLLLPSQSPGAATNSPTTASRIVAAARQQLGVTKSYDAAYVTLAYPGGDVPLKTGVCTDVIVRALRAVGLDLQKSVHEDMSQGTNFGLYPQRWGLKGPDRNIDHRRVPNLMRYFERHHISMPEKLTAPEAYRPGDIVAWDLGGKVLHIGIVTDKLSGGIPLIIHNIGRGAQEENVLLKFHQIIGHYRLKEGSVPAAPEKLGF